MYFLVVNNGNDLWPLHDGKPQVKVRHDWKFAHHAQKACGAEYGNTSCALG